MLCNRLKELRKKNNLTQSDLAKILHVGTSTISGWEVGKYFPDYDKLIFLCDYFHTSSDYLIGRIDFPDDIKSYNNIIKHIPENSKSLSTHNITSPHISENRQVINFYQRLNEENKILIKGKMVELYKEQSSQSKDSIK